jgi:hypothetical protein
MKVRHPPDGVKRHGIVQQDDPPNGSVRLSRLEITLRGLAGLIHLLLVVLPTPSEVLQEKDKGLRKADIPPCSARLI